MRGSVLLGCLLLGCSGASQGEADRGYARCVDSPLPPSRSVGGVSVQAVGDRTLRVTGLPEPTRLRVVAGPAPSEAPVDWAGAARGASALIVLGGIGDTPAVARRHAAALGALTVPVFAVGGGRDHRADLEAMTAEHGLVLHVSGARRIEIGTHAILLRAGAPARGRYAIDPAACGREASDDEALAGAARPSDSTILASWARDDALAQRLGVRLQLHAWPAEVGVGSSILVPRIAGPALTPADGSRVLGGARTVVLARGTPPRLE